MYIYVIYIEREKVIDLYYNSIYINYIIIYINMSNVVLKKKKVSRLPTQDAV